jgi:uncharacterized membrane protein YhaH (DUF805 family)
MSFGQAISTCFRKFVTFGGRARRSEYWYFVLFGILLGIPAGIVDTVMATASGNMTGGRPVTGLLALVLFLPRLSVAVRRLHDVNYSGWLIGGFFIALTVVLSMFIGLFIGVPRGGDPNFATPLGVAVIAGLVMLFGWVIWLFVLTLLRGTIGPNKYGDDPMGPNVEVFN